MNARWLALALSASLSACVGAVKPVPTSGNVFEARGYVYEARGLPLSASETVALSVSTEISCPNPIEHIEVSPINDPALMAKAVRDGFHVARPDVTIVETDKALQTACFNPAMKSEEDYGARGSGRGVLLIPNVGGADCRTLIEERGIRYFVAVGGRRVTRDEPVFLFPTLVGAAGVIYRHSFDATALAIDSTSGKKVCASRKDDDAESRVVVGFVFLIPVWNIGTLDESEYWKELGWHIGHEVGRCFVPRAEEKQNEKGSGG